MGSRRHTPKNYDGIKLTGKLACDMLPDVFKTIQKAFDAQPKNIFTVFLNSLDERMRPLVEPVFFAKGVLTVKVKNATLLSILSSQEKGRLVHNLRSSIPSIEIQDIVFQSG